MKLYICPLNPGRVIVQKKGRFVNPPYEMDIQLYQGSGITLVFTGGLDPFFSGFLRRPYLEFKTRESILFNVLFNTANNITLNLRFLWGVLHHLGVQPMFSPRKRIIAC